MFWLVLVHDFFRIRIESERFLRYFWVACVSYVSGMQCVHLCFPRCGVLAFQCLVRWPFSCSCWLSVALWSPRPSCVHNLLFSCGCCFSWVALCSLSSLSWRSRTLHHLTAWVLFQCLEHACFLISLCFPVCCCPADLLLALFCCNNTRYAARNYSHVAVASMATAI